MPSKPKPRKRKRQLKLPMTAVLWCLVVLNGAIGANFSSLTKAYRIRVEGCSPSDQARVEGILAGLKGIPSRQVNTKLIESQILENDRLGKVAYTQNIFGRGLLKIAPARFVARLKDEPLLCVSEGGSIVKVEKEIPALPEIKLPDLVDKPSALIFAPYEAGRMAELCENIKKQFPVTPWILEVRERGEISLYTGTRGEVRLGSSDKLQEKLEKLKELLEADPELLNRQDALNLTVPDAPTLDPRGRRNATNP